MNKQASKKATLQDFIAKKLQKEEDNFKTKDVYITSMDKTITLKKPTEEQILEFANEMGDGGDLKVGMEANRRIIYKCCSELQSPELHTACDVKDPYDIVKVLFDVVDVKEIMEQFAELMGYDKLNEEIKN